MTTRRHHPALFVGACVVTVVLLGGVALRYAWAETTDAKAETEQGLTEEELQQIQRRLDRMTENDQKIRQALDEIKAELAVVKLRVTR